MVYTNVSGELLAFSTERISEPRISGGRLTQSFARRAPSLPRITSSLPRNSLSPPIRSTEVKCTVC